ncbi:hypothetical protein IL306_006552 [Fusarium sp. DS 682]|nr:hypothetical protein IL306_006552 [Fusarium sp. DS 682]
MPEFKAVMSGIKALRLDIAQHKANFPRVQMRSTAVLNQCQEMFAQLPFTWLSPTVAANLQVLSLHYQSYWGWFPNIDIRLIGGGNGMPKLRSLALGRFVFSHQREVDWITSLDLEELFLEGCAVLAKHHGNPVTQKGIWTDGDLIAGTETRGETRMTSLWWYKIIRQIRTSMLNLRRFAICTHPTISTGFEQFVKMKRNNFSFGDPESSEEGELTFRSDLWDEFIGPSQQNCLDWNKAFRHSTCATSPMLSLGSDEFRRCDYQYPPISTIIFSANEYVTHRPNYLEQATYTKIGTGYEMSPELIDKYRWAQVELAMLFSMLYRKSRSQHTAAEELRLAPIIASENPKDFMERVLRPLFTTDERFVLEVISGHVFSGRRTGEYHYGP